MLEDNTVSCLPLSALLCDPRDLTERLTSFLPSHRERITYLIFDCLATDGENIMNRDFSRRLARIDNMIIRPLKLFYQQYPEAAADQPFQIEMKKMEFSYGMTMMFDHVLPALPHGNDGLIFTCKDTLYEPGTDPHVCSPLCGCQGLERTRPFSFWTKRSST